MTCPYFGGFSEEQIDELLESMADNHIGWSATMAPVIMGNPRPSPARTGTNRQFLPRRSRYCSGVCTYNFYLGQPCRSP